MRLLFLFLILTISLNAREVIRENIAKAESGDWLVVSFDKNLSFYKVIDNNGKILHLEEACIPVSAFRRQALSWREWASRGYPGSGSKLVYRVDIGNGALQIFQDNMLFPAKGNALLSTLINLELKKVQENERKRVGLVVFGSGPTETRPIWQPKLVYNGQEVKNAHFDAYKAKWPNDHTEMAGKWIEIYLPEEGSPYPSYFPYFMQITGLVAKAKLHVVDSGSGL